MQLDIEISNQHNRGKFYAFPDIAEAYTFDVGIPCTVLVFDRVDIILFDLSYTYSYVLVPFTSRIHLIFNVLDAPIYVPTPFGESTIVTHINRACSVIFIGFQTWTKLVILEKS